MKFLIVSERGDFSGAALRLKNEGNQVRIWFKEPRARNTMTGILEQVGTVAEGIAWNPDVVVYDMVGMGEAADKLRQQGKKVVGAGKLQDDLELDRAFANRVFENFGIDVPETFAFPNFSDALKFLVSYRKRLIFKPSRNLIPAYTFMGSGNDEVASFVSNLKSVRGIDGPCVLQEVVYGPEVSTEIWYANGKPVAFPNSTIEVKKFLPGDLGVSTGCAASVVWAYPVREPRLVQKSLKKMSILLEMKGYTGPLDVNGIVAGGKYYALEFSARFGYNALYALLPLLREDLGSILSRLANGDDKPMRLETGFGCALRVSIPPYPFEPDKPSIAEAIYSATRGLHVAGIATNAWGKDFFPLDCYAKGQDLFTAGFDGIVGEVTAWGQSVNEAYANAESVFREIRVPEKQGRLKDLVPIASRRLGDLRAVRYDVPEATKKVLEVLDEKTKDIPVPDHMARTTVSMPAKYD